MQIRSNYHLPPRLSRLANLSGRLNCFTSRDGGVSEIDATARAIQVAHELEICLPIKVAALFMFLCNYA